MDGILLPLVSTHVELAAGQLKFIPCSDDIVGLRRIMPAFPKMLVSGTGSSRGGVGYMCCSLCGWALGGVCRCAVMGAEKGVRKRGKERERERWERDAVS